MENPYTDPITPEEKEGRCIYFKEKPVKPSIIETVAAPLLDRITGTAAPIL